MQRVLITRPREDAAATAQRLRAAGYEPVIGPVMAVSYGRVAPPARVQAVLVTSGNALPALSAVPVPLLAVGDATAEKARAAGWADVRSAGRDAAALAAMAAATLRPQAGPLLLASGRFQGESLCAALRAGGFRVIRRVAYAAGPVARFPDEAAEALQSNSLYAATFLSAETALAFARLLPPALRVNLSNVLALAIGNAAADALKPLPWRQVRLAATPTLDGVLALL